MKLKKTDQLMLM